MQWCSFLGVHNLVRVLLQDISDLIRLSRTVQHTGVWKIIYFSKFFLPFTLANRSRFGQTAIRNVKFRPGIAFTICTNLDKSVPFTEKRKRKIYLKLVSTRISVWNIPSGKAGLTFLMFCFSRKSSAGTIQKGVFHLLANRIFRKLK